jgi:hypothetical protein
MSLAYKATLAPCLHSRSRLEDGRSDFRRQISHYDMAGGSKAMFRERGLERLCMPP